jgi:uncharacterized protein YjbI with pentapeptide repeats
MKVTQGVFKNTNVYGITFVDKYSNIKSISSTDNYISNNNISQTSTILTDDHSYYNIVENSNVVNCNIENGRFSNSKLLGNSGKTNYINDGYFSECTLSNYTINGGKFINCVVDATNKWNNGYWDNQNGHVDFSSIWINGIWNSGIFNNPYGWSGGTFNGGTFVPPAVWYDGTANGGTFSGITWHNGLVRNADFIENCKFEDGTFNGGNFINSIFSGGTFNGGNMLGSKVYGGIFNDGYVSGCTIHGNIVNITNETTIINGGVFTNDTMTNVFVNNSESDNLIVNNCKFFNGNYTNTIFNNVEIFNGVYYNITGLTSDVIIHNGIFRNSYFSGITINNGNFTNCNSDSINWKYGVYTDGEMYNSLWYDGYWNDGIFSSISGSTSNSNILNFSIISTGSTTTSTTTSPVLYTKPNIISVYSGGTNIYVSFSDVPPGATTAVIQYASNSGVTGVVTSITGDVISPRNLGLASSIPSVLLYFNMYIPGSGTTSNIVSYDNSTQFTSTSTTTSSPEPISSVELTQNSVKKTFNFNVTGGVAPYTYVFNVTTSDNGCEYYNITPSSGTIYANNGTSSYNLGSGHPNEWYDVTVTINDYTSNTLHITSNCLVPETLITMIDYSVKMLKDINVGDKLLTMFNSEYSETLVVSKSQHVVYKIININNGLLESSDSHKHLVRENYLIIEKIASELKEGDILIDKNGNDVIIYSLVVEYGDRDVINISTDLETYIANDILTHNKTECSYN